MTLLTTAAPVIPRISASPLRAGASLAPEVMARIRRTLVLHHCKWDPQVGDHSTLAPFPLVLAAGEWNRLSQWSESLAAELMACERELIARPDLHRALAVPRRLRPLLRQIETLGPTPTPVRVLRFDFHWTTDGWRISEVNSDVPGGYTEASAFTALVAEHCDEPAKAAGHPGSAWAEAVTRFLGPDSSVALMAAPGFMEDQQIVAFLARELQRRSIKTHLCDPTQLDWTDGRAHLCGQPQASFDAVFRFYQSEWLARLPRRVKLAHYFHSGKTAVTSSGSAILTESKCLPLVWDRLSTRMPTWRMLLPETRDPRDAPWRRDEAWLLKSAYCNTGDTVSARDLLTPRRWTSARRWARLTPGDWIAQRRFTPIATSTPFGDMFPCIGVYTIDGRAAGIYTRLSHRPVVDYRAIDVACLVGPEGEGR